jgi:hypothetical protein
VRVVSVCVVLCQSQKKKSTNFKLDQIDAKIVLIFLFEIVGHFDYSRFIYVSMHRTCG